MGKWLRSRAVAVPAYLALSATLVAQQQQLWLQRRQCAPASGRAQAAGAAPAGATRVGVVDKVLILRRATCLQRSAKFAASSLATTAAGRRPTELQRTERSVDHLGSCLPGLPSSGNHFQVRAVVLSFHLRYLCCVGDGRVGILGAGWRLHSGTNCGLNGSIAAAGEALPTKLRATKCLVYCPCSGRPR